MKETSHYTLYHPKWYRKPVSTYWWINQWSHFKFILRELTSVFVAYFVILTLWLLQSLSDGPESYQAFLDWMKTPVAILINLIALGFVLFHTITWFNLTPRAMTVRLGSQRLPDWMVALPNYIAWIVISAIVTWLILRGV